MQGLRVNRTQGLEARKERGAVQKSLDLREYSEVGGVATFGVK
jgi:hypothetical protein